MLQYTSIHIQALNPVLHKVGTFFKDVFDRNREERGKGVNKIIMW